MKLGLRAPMSEADRRRDAKNFLEAMGQIIRPAKCEDCGETFHSPGERGQLARSCNRCKATKNAWEPILISKVEIPLSTEEAMRYVLQKERGFFVFPSGHVTVYAHGHAFGAETLEEAVALAMVSA